MSATPYPAQRPPAAAQPPRLRSEFWRTYEEFTAQREPWNRLLAMTPDASVFLRHEWFDAAWQWAQRDSTLHIMGFFDGDALVGIAPFILQRERAFVPLRRLSFLTVPDTQVCDIIAAPPLRRAVLEALARTLSAGPWDIAELAYLPAATVTELSAQLERAGLSTSVADQATNPGISLTGGWEAYYARRSRRLKKGNNLIANKLRKAKREVTLERVGADWDPVGQLEGLMEDLVRISARSWKQETGMSLDFSGPNAFIRRLTEHAAREGWLTVWLLRLGGQAVAMEYQLRYGGRVHALRADFDAAVGDLSPGTYLNWQMLQQLFDDGAERYLMGPGENAYKLRWAEDFEQIWRLIAYGRSATGRCRRITDTVLRPWIRALRRRLQAPRAMAKEPS